MSLRQIFFFAADFHMPLIIFAIAAFDIIAATLFRRHAAFRHAADLMPLDIVAARACRYYIRRFSLRFRLMLSSPLLLAIIATPTP